MLLRKQAIRSPGRRLRRQWQALTGCAAAVAVVCAGCGGTSPPAPVGAVVGGPIQILVMAPSVNSIGNPIAATSFYRSNAHSVTAIVALGRLTGPQTIYIAWYRLTPHGPQALFDKQMTVTSYGRAYSTAVDSGRIAYGAYEVTAEVGGVTKSIEWGVYKPVRVTKANAVPPGTVLPLKPGPSGALPEPINRTRPCQWQDVISNMPTPTDVDLDVSAYCPEPGRNQTIRGTVLATMGKLNGQSVLGMMHTEPNGVIAGNFRFDVCTLPSGSDVPGSRFGITTIVYYQGSTRSFTFSAGLPGELLGPEVRISSSVPNGTQVHPGEKIKLRIIATEPGRLGAQAGIGNIKVNGPDGQIKFRRYPRVRTGCERLRAYRVLYVTYKVPAVAPKVIKIAAIASDVPGAKAIADVSFPFAA